MKIVVLATLESKFESEIFMCGVLRSLQLKPSAKNQRVCFRLKIYRCWGTCLVQQPLTAKKAEVFIFSQIIKKKMIKAVTRLEQGVDGQIEFYSDAVHKGVSK